jgi:zinc transport system substrate-binding protein
MKKVLSLMLLTLIAGCSTNTSDPTTKLPSVISSFYPIEFIVSQIEPGLKQHNLVGTQNIHGFDLTTADVVMMEKADLVIGLNLKLEPWLEASENKNLFLANSGLKLLEATKDFHHDEHDDEHADEHADEHHDEHAGAHDGHDHGNLTHDPHVWLSPVNMLAVADNIYGALEAKQLLTNGAAERLASLKSEFQQLDTAYKTTLTDCNANTALISHNSFAYLEDLYNFDLTSIMGLSSFDRLSLKNLRDLQNVQTNSVLIEALENQEYANTLKKDMNLDSFVVYNLSKQVDELDYLTMQYKNLESLKLALECL